MHDHKRRDSLRLAMNRRVFLATMGGAAGSIVLGTPLPGGGPGLSNLPGPRSSSVPLSPIPDMVGPYATGC